MDMKATGLQRLAKNEPQSVFFADFLGHVFLSGKLLLIRKAIS